MLKGELLVAVVWWEGKEGWIQILSEGNKWPANTDLATAWKIENTGDEVGMFSVRFMDMESVGVQLSPGESAWVYIYPITPDDGVYHEKADYLKPAQDLIMNHTKEELYQMSGCSRLKRPFKITV